MFHKYPPYHTLRVFHCLCYAYNMNIHKDKFDTSARKCIFLGYPYGQKASKAYDLHTHTTFVSRDVIFFENIFPYLTSISSQKNPTSPTSIIDFSTSFDNITSTSDVSHNTSHCLSSSPNSPVPNNTLSSNTPSISISSHNSTHNTSAFSFNDDDISFHNTNDLSSSHHYSPSNDLPLLRTFSRLVQPLIKLTDYVHT